MKALLVLVPCIALSGCAYLHSTTTRGVDQYGSPVETTKATGITWFDSHNELTKFRNSSGYGTNGVWAPGTSVSGLNQQSQTTTNLNDLIGTVVGAAVKAAVKP